MLIPEHYTHEQGSTLPIAYATAWSSLYSHAIKLQAGQTVLCLGTGGVSLAAAQLALIAGAKAIITSSSQRKLDRARQILAPLTHGRDDAIQTIDYSKIDKWDDEVKRLTRGRGVDFVIEIGGRGTLGRSLRSTKRGGFVAISGELAGVLLHELTGRLPVQLRVDPAGSAGRGHRQADLVLCGIRPRSLRRKPHGRGEHGPGSVIRSCRTGHRQGLRL